MMALVKTVKKLTRREFVATGAAAGALGMAGCARRQVAPGPLAPALPTLRETGAARGILAGCAVQVRHLADDPAYAALVKSQAGIIVEESALKFGPLRPSPTDFFFDHADYLVQFAEANGMKVRGHNFVWHRQLPKWFADYVTADNAQQVLVEHIERVGGRYAGKIHSWDVVNEAILISDGLPGGFRNSPWQKVLPGTGEVPTYIEIAFRTARRIDPNAMLCYNDYDIEGEDEKSVEKRAAVIGLLRAMQRQKVPLDALGVQSHISAGGKHVYGPGLKAMIAEARGMGLKVLLTEMDVNDRALPADNAVRDHEVGEVYGNFLREALADPAVVATLTWGITDRYTWLNNEGARPDKLPERCLPFDADLKPKPAFEAEIRELQRALPR